MLLNLLVKTKDSAAVSCSSVPYRLGAGGIWFWDDGQAGPCMASVHGWCMGVWGLGGILLLLNHTSESKKPGVLGIRYLGCSK